MLWRLPVNYVFMLLDELRHDVEQQNAAAARASRKHARPGDIDVEEIRHRRKLVGQGPGYKVWDEGAEASVGLVRDAAWYKANVAGMESAPGSRSESTFFNPANPMPPHPDDQVYNAAVGLRRKPT